MATEKKTNDYQELLDAIKKYGESVDNAQKFQEIYVLLSRKSGYIHKAAPVLKETRPGEFAMAIEFSIIKLMGDQKE